MNDLHAEHKPTTPTERLLVMDMARHYWLLQRAIRLQEECFTRGLDDGALEKQLALYMRYQTTNQRAFHRCLNELLKLRAGKRKRPTPVSTNGFESKNDSEARTELVFSGTEPTQSEPGSVSNPHCTRPS